MTTPSQPVAERLEEIEARLKAGMRSDEYHDAVVYLLNVARAAGGLFLPDHKVGVEHARCQADICDVAYLRAALRGEQ